MLDADRPKRAKNTFGDYFVVGEVFGYFFRKPDPTRKTNFNLRTMHTINKISILMFLFGLVYVVVRAALR
jgi:Ni,Fe-hydrogenase I cytochrome b subunit